MPSRSMLTEWLKKKGLHYELMSHDKAFTASEVAEKQHVPGEELAKTVVVKDRKKYALVVLPSTHRINMEELAQCMGTKHIALASEGEFRDLFPDCDLGAMPPFGELYHMPVWVDETLTWDKEIVFNAGTHTDTFRMSYADFEGLVKPKLGRFAYRI